MSTAKTQFIKSIAADAQRLSQGTGILPDTVLTVAAHESNFGRSKLSTEAKNLFGIKAGSSWTGATYDISTKEYVAIPGMPPNLYPSKMVVAKFRKYNTWAASIADFLQLMKAQRYAGVKVEKTPTGQFKAMQKAGYATDPSYAAKLSNLLSSITTNEKIKTGGSIGIIALLAAGTAYFFYKRQKK